MGIEHTRANSWWTTLTTQVPEVNLFIRFSPAWLGFYPETQDTMIWNTKSCQELRGGGGEGSCHSKRRSRPHKQERTNCWAVLQRKMFARVRNVQTVYICHGKTSCQLQAIQTIVTIKYACFAVLRSLMFVCVHLGSFGVCRRLVSKREPTLITLQTVYVFFKKPVALNYCINLEVIIMERGHSHIAK